ncbi:hypothetical protein [Roseovarius salinarum]|uniref:hypothetical protein n=1 Tax=Roseovarius salinarum TaxID=1981892 RepID=UPI0012FFDC90|nr:hypothetical protein [Roseovarius salinarum]
MPGLSAARAQELDEARVGDLLNAVYAMHAGLVASGKGGVLDTPVLGGQFFEQALLDALGAAADEGDPLTAGTGGVIEDFEVVLPPGGAGEGTRDAVVMVTAGGATQAVAVRVALDARGAPQIVGLGYGDHSFGRLAAGGTQTETASGDAAAGDGAVPSAPTLPYVARLDQSALPAAWEVVNENRDAYLPEAAGLFVIASGGDDRFDDAEGENIFRLAAPAPEGDWDQTLTGTVTAKTGYEAVWNGVYSAPDNYLAAQLFAYPNGCGDHLYLTIENSRPRAEAAPLVSEFEVNLFNGAILADMCGAGRAAGDAVVAGLAEAEYRLTLSKRGFRYFAEVAFPVPASKAHPEGVAVARTPMVAHFGPVGTPAMMLGQWRRAGSGESEALFTQFEIQPVE